MPLSLLLLSGCYYAEPGSEVAGESVNITTGAKAAALPEVEVQRAELGRLTLRRQVTGKLRARREVVIRSEVGGVVTQAPMEGKYYAASEPLVQLDLAALDIAERKAIVDLERARYEERDRLLRLGTNLHPSDSARITDLARANIHIQSGIPEAEMALEEIQYRKSLCSITAPFDGHIADVVVQTGDLITPGQQIGALIDGGSLEVEFSLLEQELGDLERGTTIYIMPVANSARRIPAKIDIINPRVDDGGLLRVRAGLSDQRNTTKLFAGMNVTVALESKAPEAVVVPKSAVVTRSGRSLVFVYDQPSGRTRWQYVTILAENDSEVALAEGVTAGQLVIVGGNLNLDHDVEVALAASVDTLNL